MHMSCLLFLYIDTIKKIIMNKVQCIIVNVYEHAHIEVRGQIVTRMIRLLGGGHAHMAITGQRSVAVRIARLATFTVP